MSGGWNKEGVRYLQEWEELWHRIDVICDASEHLDDWGTATTTRDQLENLYPWCNECFRWMEPYIMQRTFLEDTAPLVFCKCGHHRSAAFVELFARYLNTKYPGLAIWVRHS